MKLSDYVVKRLADWGVRHVFLVTGGGAMHLNDSIAGEPRITYVCNHHEQASAMAAEAYARVARTPGIVNVTTGPGGINALNGVFGAWTDSVPMLVLSGQVKRETCMRSRKITGLRQLGDQEADIVSMVAGITKYAMMVDDPGSIRYHLERAYYLASHGRPGPCWLDIPIDVQSAPVEESSMTPYDPGQDEITWDRAEIRGICRQLLKRIADAKRPVIMAGTGLRIANAEGVFEQIVHALGIPVTTAWTHDVIASDDPLFCGRPGTIGGRAGNFTVQNADLLLILGSRLNIRQVSYNWPAFAPRAFKIQVDIDEAELKKPLVRPDLPVHCDLKVFLEELLAQCDSAGYKPGKHDLWLSWCRERMRRYPAVQDRQRCPGPPLNGYYFMERLSRMLKSDDVVVCGNATACIVPFQAMPLKAGQRLISNSGSASMGYDLPAAIGACVARGKKRVICLAGDGSIQMNIQELQTIMHHRLPVKLFILNNGGYLSMRLTQTNFFARAVGESASSGVSFPDMVKIGAAYGIPSIRVDRAQQFQDVESMLNEEGPSLIEVMLDPHQEFEPRLRARQMPDGTIVSPSLEDMYPFLDRDELSDNVIEDK
ncbi:MAG TPA: thiamine pyrophosphate-binding protein [Candidatus Angelobacter sp.]|nr:thiamine pyrophosphate-binding protein [Candidatus Angelobacter sp.]